MSTNHTKKESPAQAEASRRMKGDERKSIGRYADDFRRNITEFIRSTEHVLPEDEIL